MENESCGCIALWAYLWGIPVVYVMWLALIACSTRYRANLQNRDKYPWYDDICRDFSINNPNDFEEVASWLGGGLLIALLWPVVAIVGIVVGIIKLIQILFKWFINAEINFK